MDPKLQAMMARRAAMMDDIDDDACYREDANARKATAAAPTEVRGGRALDLTRAYKMESSGIARTPPRPASMADIDMDEHEPAPIFGERVPQHSPGPPAQEGAPPPEPARPSVSMSDFSDYTEHEAKPTPRMSDESDYTEPEAKPTTRQGELPAQPSPTLDRQLQHKSPSLSQTSPMHSGGRESISDVSSPLSHSSPTQCSHSHSRAATKVRLSAEEALLQFTANSRCMSVQRISNVTSKSGIRVLAAEQEESFSTLAMRAKRERAEHEARMAMAASAHSTITATKQQNTDLEDLGKNLAARVCTVQKVSKNNAKTQCHDAVVCVQFKYVRRSWLGP
jgi:hypothetical protein